MTGNRIATFDIGGGTFRSGVFTLGSGRAVSLESPPQARQLRFNNAADLINSSYRMAREFISAEQHSCVFSFAGPVNTDLGTIVKLTNHGVEERDIPFAESISGLFMQNDSRNIRVKVINDGEAGAYAEFGSQGALGDLNDGDLGMALIWGNGIGGRLYQKAGNRIIPVPGAFEPGHYLIDGSSLLDFGIDQEATSEFAAGLSCGCGIAPSVQRGVNSLCMEAVLKGPSLQTLFSLAAGRSIDLRDVASSFLTGADDPIIDGVLSAAAKILASRLEAMQRGFDDLAPITFALIGGVGVNLGKWIVPNMEVLSRSMKIQDQKPVWAQTPRYVVGAFPSDETNLWGNIFYGLAHPQ